MQHKFSQKMSFFILAIATLVFTLLLSYTVFSSNFEVTFPTTTIKIEAAASKNSSSWGTDVRIVEVKVNDVPIPWDDFEKNGEWTDSDGLLIAINPAFPASIEYSAPDAESL